MIGRILAELPVERTVPGAERIRWVRAECGGKVLAAADLVQAQPGDRVIVCTGAAAARMVMPVPADAVVTAILREREIEVDKTGEKRL